MPVALNYRQGAETPPDPSPPPPLDVGDVAISVCCYFNVNRNGADNHCTLVTDMKTQIRFGQEGDELNPSSFSLLYYKQNTTLV